MYIFYDLNFKRLFLYFHISQSVFIYKIEIEKQIMLAEIWTIKFVKIHEKVKWKFTLVKQTIEIKCVVRYFQ